VPGVAFVGIADLLGVTDRVRVVPGIRYGVVTWVGLPALVLSRWLQTVGVPNTPVFPNFAPASLCWHLTCGAVVGAVAAVVPPR
jgi:hypothetical protein